MKDLAQASLVRLKNLGITEDELQRLRATGVAERTVPYRSPVSGIVLEKTAQKGMRFMPGEVMYKIGDLSRVWVIADVFEQDIGLIRSGLTAKVRIDAYPEREFVARITRIYPALNLQTRTVPVRMEIANGGSLLRPGMFARTELSAGNGGKVLAVPESAVIYGGRRDIVLVELGEGRYEPREVRLGAHDDDYAEVLEGIAAGEQVVVAANFLIDAESNLKAAIGGFGGHAAHTGEPEAAPPANRAQPAHDHRGH
jgi:Cu(I)/Ag(I) efflux system membrane fusion protein